MRKTFAPLLLLLALPIFAAEPWGDWTNEEDGATFTVYERDGALFMKLVDPGKKARRKKHPKTDILNPDPALRSRPLVGLEILSDCRPSKKKGRWDGGTVYSPKEGRRVRAYLQMIDENRFELRGYVGFTGIGKSQFFTRVSKSAGADSAGKTEAVREAKP